MCPALLLLSAVQIAPSDYNDSSVGLIRAWPSTGFTPLKYVTSRPQTLECWIRSIVASCWHQINQNCSISSASLQNKIESHSSFGPWLTHWSQTQGTVWKASDATTPDLIRFFFTRQSKQRGSAEWIAWRLCHSAVFSSSFFCTPFPLLWYLLQLFLWQTGSGQAGLGSNACNLTLPVAHSRSLMIAGSLPLPMLV